MNPQTEHDDAIFLNYMKRRITDLDHRQRFASLMMDKIHIKLYFDYKGGSITGVAHNSNEARADAEFLHNLVRDIICGLENIGYRVVAVVVNRKAMSQFELPPSNQIVFPHPSEHSRPLFFVIDPVHLLKCVRNNRLHPKNYKYCFYFLEFPTEEAQRQHMCSDSFQTIRDPYSLEC